MPLHLGSFGLWQVQTCRADSRWGDQVRAARRIEVKKARVHRQKAMEGAGTEKRKKLESEGAKFETLHTRKPAAVMSAEGFNESETTDGESQTARGADGASLIRDVLRKELQLRAREALGEAAVGP